MRSSLSLRRLLDFARRTAGDEHVRLTRRSPGEQIDVRVVRVVFHRSKFLSNGEIRCEVEEFEAMIDAIFQQKQRTCFGETRLQTFVDRGEFVRSDGPSWRRLFTLVFGRNQRFEKKIRRGLALFRQMQMFDQMLRLCNDDDEQTMMKDCQQISHHCLSVMPIDAEC